ncbi:MAG: hypothetical protein EHM62_05245 [Methylococcus sp.]|nr:MAG: hypothetical protein EHM62_05245 [Methylococcus sp.]
MLLNILFDLLLLIALYFAAAWLIHNYLKRGDAPASSEASAPASGSSAADISSARAKPESISPAESREDVKITPAVAELAVPVPAHREPAKGVAGAVHEALGTHWPEESVLRRHGLTETLCQINELHAAPSDSVLRRHRGQLIQARIEACIRDPAELLRLRAEHAAHELEQRQRPALAAVAPTASPAGDPEAGVAAMAEAAPVAATGAAPMPLSATAGTGTAGPVSLRLPEDSVLRRHFLQNLRARIEAVLPPPTCSILKRHYEQLLEMELDAFG